MQYYYLFDDIPQLDSLTGIGAEMLCELYWFLRIVLTFGWVF